MTRLKAIVGPHNTVCSVEVPGQWTWLIDGVKWVWRESAGDNVSVKIPTLPERPLCFCKTLDEACVYSRGFMAGWYARETVLAQMARQAAKAQK